MEKENKPVMPGAVGMVLKVAEQIAAKKPAEQPTKEEPEKKVKHPKNAQEAPKAEKLQAKVEIPKIIQDIMAKDSTVQRVFMEITLRNPKIEDFVSTRFEAGKNLSTVGHDLEKALNNREFVTTREMTEAVALLGVIERTTGERFLIPPIEGGVPGLNVYNETDPSQEKVITNPELINKLKEINYNLRTNKRFKYDTHRLNNAALEIGKLGRQKGIPEAQIEEATNRINKFIEEAERGGAKVGLSSDWIDQKDEHGNVIEPPDSIDIGGVTHDLTPLKQLIKELRSVGGTDDPRQWSRQYGELQSLAMNPDGSPSPIANEVKPYLERIDRVFDQVFGERLRLTPDKVLRMARDPAYRDEQFYDRLKKLLETPEEESHHVMGLYEKHDLDAFMHAVSEMEVFDKNTGKPVSDAERRKVTEGIRRLYEIRIGALENFHDVDYWSRHGAGDIKSLQGTVARIQNYQYRDVMSDPYVQTMRGCYEKALLSIRASHDGYIPPNLLSPDPLREGKTYWDDLAMQYFQSKVEAGEMYDVVRDEHGTPERTAKGDAFLLQDHPVSPDIIEKQHLRLLATQQLARGVMDLEFRTFEIIGMSKVPGFDSNEFGIKEPSFSSKPYGQLARWFNSMGEWLGKYHMGTTLHEPFFQSLIEPGKTWHHWSTNRWADVMGAVLEGRLDEKYPRAKRLIDMVEETSFSGRFGPMSKWGIKDSIVGWTDKQKERLGGSLRMTLSGEWSENQVKEKYKVANANKGEKWIKFHWERDKNEGEWKTEVDNQLKTNRTWLWVQFTARHPAIVAGYLRESFIDKNGKPGQRLLRDRLIKEILGIDMEEFYKEANRTPSEDHRKILDRIARLEADVDIAQQKAMNMQTGEPRDIRAEDFNGITEIDNRRQNAIKYWEMTRAAVLGSWSPDEWRDRLGMEYRTWIDKEGKEHKDVLIFNKYQKIDSILQKDAPAAPGLLRPLICNEDLLTRNMMQHISTEDCQWRFLDVETLGPPHWNRRVGDLSSHIEAVQAEIAYLDMLTANPNIPKLSEALGKIYMSEKNHDPAQAHKYVYMFAKATGDIYRQSHWGRLIPFGGRIASRIVPSSIAQKFFETTRAAAWSANNERQWVDQFSDGRMLPMRRFYGGKDWGQYNAESLAKSLGATRIQQILEVALIGIGLSALMTAILALTESQKEARE